MALKRKIPLEVTDASEQETLKAETNGSSPSNKYKVRDLSARFTKSTTAADLDLSLCPRCRVINLEAVITAASAGEDLNGTIIAKVAPLTEAVTTSTCRLCAFLPRVGLRNIDYIRGQKKPWQLCAFDSLTARGFHRTKARLLETQSIVLVLLYPSESWYRYASQQRLILPSSWPGAAAQQSSSFLYCARDVCASSINYGVVKQWLRNCESGHKSCRLRHPVIKPAKVIDCVQRKVVPCTFHTEYLALSYVWGKQSESDEESNPSPGNGKLPYRIPKAISDAMSIVLSLGYQYLWVDRFCIDQDNAEEKHDQISRMDEVYEGALVTIVAASSKAAYNGIPGVSIPRVNTPCVRISTQLCLQAPLSSVRQSLRTSEWNKRGWTYQEFCLSRRCLIFADEQVHFICKGGTTCEGVNEGTLNNLPVPKWSCLDPSILEERSRYAPPALFQRHLRAYTRRTLSYDSDKLNAFRGVLSRSRMSSYWGVPVYETEMTPESAPANIEVRVLAPFYLGFCVGLCWKSRGPTSGRRSGSSRGPESNTGKVDGLPTWTWISCRGKPYYDTTAHNPYNGMKNDEECISKSAFKYFAEVYLDDPSSNCHERLIALTRPSGDRSRIIPERSPFIYIRSVVKIMEEHVGSPYHVNVYWDSGIKPKCEDFPFLLITLLEDVIGHTYMIVKMEGDVARRVGYFWLIVHMDSSLRSLGVQTIKVA